MINYISLEDFKRVLSLLEDHSNMLNAIYKGSDGNVCLSNFCDNLYKVIDILFNRAFTERINRDVIGWWLYDYNKVLTVDGKDVILKTAEQLYDYCVECYNDETFTYILGASYTCTKSGTLGIEPQIGEIVQLTEISTNEQDIDRIKYLVVTDLKGLINHYTARGFKEHFNLVQSEPSNYGLLRYVKEDLHVRLYQAKKDLIENPEEI